MNITKLAVSSWSWHDAYYKGQFSLLDLPAAAASLSLSQIECNDFFLPPPRLSRLKRPLLHHLPGWSPDIWRYSTASLNRLKQNMQAHQVRCLCWTLNSDFAVAPLGWPFQQIYLRLGAAAAQKLQAPLLRLNLGGRADAPTSLDTKISQRLARFAHYCQEKNPQLQLVVENHWGISTSIERHLQIVQQAQEQGTTNLSICFDPGNIPLPDREKMWPLLAQAAAHYHFKTNHFDEQGQETTLPHQHLFHLLRQANYNGCFTIEFEGDGAAAEGVRRSMALFEQLVSHNLGN